MEISQVQPLLLLLASLFFLPSLRAIDFEYCNQKGYDFGNITRVELSRNPVKYGLRPTVTIYGSASSAGGINEGSVDVSMIYEGGSTILDSYTLYFLGALPIRAGKDFVIHLDEFPVEFENHNDIKYGVSLFDDENDTHKEKLCVKFHLPISTLTLISA